MSDWLDITGFNQGEILSLYERDLSDPASVDPATRAAFERWTPPGAPRRPDGADAVRLVGAVNLADAIRRYGHLAAAVDPLATEPRTDPVLLPATHGIAEADLEGLPAEVVGVSIAAPPATTTRTSSPPTSAPGCTRPPSRGGSASRPIPSTPTPFWSD
jgi:2-oxoglutarate dehydrogenase E1 component